MRRPKKSSQAIKTLTAAVAAVAITSGAITAYAAEGYGAIRIGETGQVIALADLRENLAYRQLVIQSFLRAEAPLYAGNTDEDTGVFAPIESELNQVTSPEFTTTLAVTPYEDD